MDNNFFIEEINKLRKIKNAIIMAHYYQITEIQDIADFVGDSLALAQEASKTNADIIVICGVHFMGETAKIICPNKKVLIPDINAGCSLADSCNYEDLKKFKDKNKNYKIISYVNTSAAVKSLTDVVVTSSNALKIVEHYSKDEKILFGPDKNLGDYINSITGRNMKLWNGACHVHSRFSVNELIKLKNKYPQAIVLAHPECKKIILELSDVIGSTQALLNFVINDKKNNSYIVVTEAGILHKMKEACPNKNFIPVPAEAGELLINGKLIPCSCNECEYMRMNNLEKLYLCLRDEINEINIDNDILEKAIKPINKMLELSNL